MRQVILNFHGLGRIPEGIEEDECPYWISTDRFNAILDLAERVADRARLRVTFDDGNASDLEIAAPILNERGLTATFFVLSDRLTRPGYLAGEDLQALLGMGHAIGVHGAGHVDWTKLDAGQESAEWREARERIASAAGRAVDEAAIPFGRYNAHVIRRLRSEGYRAVYTSDGGAMASGQFVIPRTSPRSDMDLDTVERILLGDEPVGRKLRREMAKFAKRTLL